MGRTLLRANDQEKIVAEAMLGGLGRTEAISFQRRIFHVSRQGVLQMRERRYGPVLMRTSVTSRTTPLCGR